MIGGSLLEDALLTDKIRKWWILNCEQADGPFWCLFHEINCGDRREMPWLIRNELMLANWWGIAETHMSQNRPQTSRSRVCWSTYRSRSFSSSFRTWISTAAAKCLPRREIHRTDLRSSDSLARCHRKYSDWACVRVFASIASTFCSTLRWPYFYRFVSFSRSLFSLANRQVLHQPHAAKWGKMSQWKMSTLPTPHSRSNLFILFLLTFRLFKILCIRIVYCPLQYICAICRSRRWDRLRINWLEKISKIVFTNKQRDREIIPSTDWWKSTRLVRKNWIDWSAFSSDWLHQELH